jgi:hypothetical protein
MMNQVSEDGNYWNVLENATQEEIIFQSCESLAEVLMDYTIKQVLFNMWGVKNDPMTWTDGVHTYAYGS